ncbi:MAG: cytochrome c oxidase subunit II [Rickettsiales bacterium]
MARLFPSIARAFCFVALTLMMLSALPVRAETAPAAAEKAETAAPAPAAAVKPPTAEEKAALLKTAAQIEAFDASKIVGHATPWQLYYQAPASPMMHTIENLHDLVMVIITAITVLVTGLMLYVMIRFRKSAHPVPKKFAHNTTVEIVWTVVPILILIAIGIPSIRAHYQVYFNQEALNNPDLTLKVVGHQWYWSYEYPDYNIAYDANIKADKDLLPNEPRLLAVDNAVVVPVNKVVKVQMTGADVIHDWAVPAFGVKKDAIPGRLNETWFKAEKEGIYYGQCSELCGKGHGFMPIMVVVVSEPEFEAWVKGAQLKYAANDTMQFAALGVN